MAQKILIYDFITLFIYVHCDGIRHLPAQTWPAYFSLSVQPLSTNFGSNLGQRVRLGDDGDDVDLVLQLAHELNVQRLKRREHSFN